MHLHAPDVRAVRGRRVVVHPTLVSSRSFTSVHHQQKHLLNAIPDLIGFQGRTPVSVDIVSNGVSKIG